MVQNGTLLGDHTYVRCLLAVYSFAKLSLCWALCGFDDDAASSVGDDEQCSSGCGHEYSSFSLKNYGTNGVRLLLIGFYFYGNIVF